MHWEIFVHVFVVCSYESRIECVRDGRNVVLFMNVFVSSEFLPVYAVYLA